MELKKKLYSIERKKYILELKNSEQRYSDIFQMSPQPAWCVDTQTQKFLEVNDASITHYGYSRDEFLAMRLNDLCPEMCMDSFAHSTVESHTDRTSFVGVYCHYKKDGQDIIVEIKSRLIHRQGQQVCLMLVNDITAQREYIKNIEYQNQMLQDIIWAQSHQVRAPLARLQGLVQLLQIHDLRGSTTQESATLLAAIQDSSQELDHIIRTVVKKTEDVQIHLRQSTLLS